MTFAVPTPTPIAPTPAHAVRLCGSVVGLHLITRPCAKPLCDHPLMAVRADTGRTITVPASLVART